MNGIYILIIHVKKKIKIKIGKLGYLEFKKGKYAYVGSAQNNIKKRIKRHFSKHKKRFWHIDYLLLNKDVKLKKAFWKKAKKREECRVACFLENYEEPIKGFGCSDCKCYSHLFRLNGLGKINKLNMTTFQMDKEA